MKGRLPHLLIAGQGAVLSTKSWFHYVVFIASSLLLLAVVYSLPFYGDWDDVYYPVAHGWQNPYAIPGFFNAPWLVWLLAPFSLLPQHLGGAIWVTLSLLVVIGVVHHLGGGLWATGLCLLSPASVRFMTAGQVDAVPLLGFALLLLAGNWRWQGLGFVLILVKPQIFGAGLLPVWWGLSRRDKGLVLLPLLGVLLLSGVMYGFWPARVALDTLNQTVDFSLWPYGIPLGLGMLGWSIWRCQPVWGGMATSLLVPYLAPYSLFAYTAVLFSVTPRWVSAGLFLVLWVVALFFT